MSDEQKYNPYEYGKQPELNEEDVTIEIDESEFEELEFDEADYEESRRSTFQDEYVPRYDYSYTQPTPQKDERDKKSGAGKKILLTVILAVLFGVLASTAYQLSNRVMNGLWGEVEDDDKSGKPVSSTQISANSGTTVNSDIADVTESVMPSVVSIINLSVQEVQNYFFGGTIQQESQSSGSGIIVGQNETELLIVTNNHVIEGSKTLTVTFADGSSVEVQVKGSNSSLDLAILSVPVSSVDSETLEAIKVATLGDSDALRVGEPAIAIGNALGYGQSVTAGIISALNCTMESYKGKLIQTDAAINPGNSGGALLNANGEVIGINTAKVSDESVEGMGYAIPISDVLDELKELMTKETRTKVAESERGAIGIEGITVAAEMSQYYKMPEGVYVSKLIEGGAAEKAELPLYCIITEIDGNSVDTLEELQEQLQYYRAGETVELTIMVQSRNSGYEEETIKITLGKAN